MKMGGQNRLKILIASIMCLLKQILKNYKFTVSLLLRSMLFACASCKVVCISLSMKVQSSHFLQVDNVYMYISKQQVLSCKSTATQSHGILFG